MTSSDLIKYVQLREDAQRRKDAQLREDAEGRLTSGTAPSGGGWAMSADSLGILYELASSPDTADDALKLLNELQVHQIELGLQQEQIEAAERETAEALSHYLALYELAPVPYFVLDRVGDIIDANSAGADLLGVRRERYIGSPLEMFLQPESRAAAKALFTMPPSDGESRTGLARFASTNITARLAVSIPPSKDFAMVVVSEIQGSARS